MTTEPTSMVTEKLETLRNRVERWRLNGDSARVSVPLGELRAALLASQSTPAPPEVGELVKKLRIKSGMVRMGEPIAFGSDADLMDEAADALEAAAALSSGWRPTEDDLAAEIMQEIGGRGWALSRRIARRILSMPLPTPQGEQG